MNDSALSNIVVSTDCFCGQLIAAPTASSRKARSSPQNLWFCGGPIHSSSDCARAIAKQFHLRKPYPRPNKIEAQRSGFDFESEVLLTSFVSFAPTFRESSFTSLLVVSPQNLWFCGGPIHSSSDCARANTKQFHLRRAHRQKLPTSSLPPLPQPKSAPKQKITSSISNLVVKPVIRRVQ